jgi:hypothetical protein
MSDSPKALDAPVIVCLCGDIFPTTEAMRLHLDMVHTQPKALDARQQHEPVNCGMSWDDAMGYQPKSSQPSSVSSIAEVKTRLNYVNEVLVGAEGTSADLHAVLDAQEAVRQVADRVEALEQDNQEAYDKGLAYAERALKAEGQLSVLRARAERAEADRDTLKGAMNAQDERERHAGQTCGVPAEIHGCDWPDAVAETVFSLQAARDALAKHCASLEADREYNAGLVREVTAERDRLKKYAIHFEDCERMTSPWGDEANPACTCGLSALLAPSLTPEQD